MKNIASILILSTLLMSCAASPEAQKASESFSKQGFAMLNVDRPKDAVVYFDRALKENISNIQAYQGKGIALNKQGRHAEAETVYERGLSFDPHAISIINNYGLSKILREDYNGAIEILEPHSRSEPVHAKVIENLALAYCLKGDHVSARKLYKTRLPKTKIEDNIKFCSQFDKLKYGD